MNRIQDLLDNPHLLRFYAKKSCTSCMGRGLKEIQLSINGGGFDEVGKQVCHCVKNAIKREEKELAREEKTMAG